MKKEAKKAASRKFYRKNKKKICTKSASWNKENPEKVKKIKHKYYAKNVERIKVYYKNNKEKILLASKARLEQRKLSDYDPFATFAYHPHRICTIE